MWKRPWMRKRGDQTRKSGERIGKNDLEDTETGRIETEGESTDLEVGQEAAITGDAIAHALVRGEGIEKIGTTIQVDVGIGHEVANTGGPNGTKIAGRTTSDLDPHLETATGDPGAGRLTRGMSGGAIELLALYL